VRRHGEKHIARCFFDSVFSGPRSCDLALHDSQESQGSTGELRWAEGPSFMSQTAPIAGRGRLSIRPVTRTSGAGVLRRRTGPPAARDAVEGDAPSPPCLRCHRPQHRVPCSEPPQRGGVSKGPPRRKSTVPRNRASFSRTRRQGARAGR
jgi:hypothetical protein